MSVIETGVIGFDVEVYFDHVILNGVIKVVKPKKVSTTDWEKVWGRMDASYSNNADIEDQMLVVHMDHPNG